MSGPDCKARLGGSGIARGIDHPGGIKMHHSHTGGASCKLCLRKSIDLRARETVTAPWICIGRKIDTIGICTDMRVIAEEWTGILTAGVRSIVCDINAVDIPTASGV